MTTTDLTPRPILDCAHKMGAEVFACATSRAGFSASRNNSASIPADTASDARTRSPFFITARATSHAWKNRRA